MQHCRPALAQTWGCGQQQTDLNHSGISTFCSQQHGKGMGLGRVDAPVMQQTFHLQQSVGAGDFSSCKLGLWRAGKIFFSPSFCIPTQMSSPTAVAAWPGLLSQGALLDAGFGNSLSEMAQQKPTVREYLSFPPFPFLLQ